MNRNRKLHRVTCPVCAQPVRARHTVGTVEVLLEVGEHQPLGVTVRAADGAPLWCAGGGALIEPPPLPPIRRPSYEADHPAAYTGIR